MISRKIYSKIRKDLEGKKAIILHGARQVGKTTLTKKILEDLGEGTIIFNGDEADVRTLFENPTSVRLRNIIGNSRIIVFDEAQRIPDIGIIVKLIIDQIEGVKVFVTGSSSLELMSKLNEPLTGRKFEHLLFPFSFSELVDHHSFLEEFRQLKHRLVFGCYPEIVTSPGEEIRLLKLITNSYLYKDIFALNKVKKPVLLDKLVRALALQVGNEVSYHELAGLVGMDKGTVETYIDLLEKAFVVFRLEAFSRNMRTEIKKGKKVFFWDNGVLNAITGNFSPVELRKDIGALWENYIVSERMKYNAYRDFHGKAYFWRTTQQQEIDFIEEIDGRFHAYEFKWNPKKKVKFPKTFVNNYPVSNTQIITPDNYDSFLL